MNIANKTVLVTGVALRKTRRPHLSNTAGVWLAAVFATAAPGGSYANVALYPLTCDGQWHTVRVVDATKNYGDFNSLNAVAALSSTDVWAVGQFRVFAQK